MSKARVEVSLDEANYSKLLSLINQRQEFERTHSNPPFNLHKTDINFTDVNDNSLLYYAAAMGDLEKVGYCLQNNANINYVNQSKVSAIGIALQNGHLDVAQALFDQGASCTNVDLTYCNNDKQLRQWLTDKIQHALKESYPEPANEFEYPTVDNQFFYRFLDEYTTSISLQRAAEIGDIEFIKTVITADINPITRASKIDIDQLLKTAAKNGQLNTVQFLVENNAHINSNKQYSDTALILAIQNNHQDVIDYLLDQDIDINQEGRGKNTALVYAILNNNEETIKKLIAKGAKIDNVNVNGNTILHLAIRQHSEYCIKLLDLPGIAELAKIKNIYGDTALDLAIQYKQDDLIKLLSPASDLDLIKQSPNYGVPRTPILQINIMNKMVHRLKIKYRDTNYFNLGGHCNGFAFLKSFYAAQGKEDYFFDTMALMAGWDGNDISLQQEFKNIPQAAYYKNLDELFEQWTNDVIWFQHSTVADIDSLAQSARLEQLSILSTKEQKGYEYHLLYKEPDINIGDNNKIIKYDRNPQQLAELFIYLMRMPSKVHFELAGGEHVTSSYKNDADIFVYYDPNFQSKTENTKDLKENIQRIIDYKYILLDKFEGSVECKLNVFCFEKDFPSMNLEGFAVFDEKELPKTKEEALLFQKNSPNQFTPLHVAVMTKSLASLKKLLTDGYCDIHAVDCLGRNAIKIAIDSGFSEAVTLLLQSTEFQSTEIDKLISRAYIAKKMEVVAAMLDCSNAKNLNRLLIEAINKQDFDLIQKLLKSKQANVNQAENGTLPLICAINTNNVQITEYLLKSGADMYLNNGKSNSTTALEAACSNDCDCTATILSYIKDIDLPDSTGQTAIHYASLYSNPKTIKTLIELGANVNLRSTSGETVFNYFDKDLFANEEKTNQCLKLLIPKYQFNLSNANDKKLLGDYLNKSVKAHDEEFFKMVLNQCNKEIINSVTINDKPLIPYCLLNEQYSKIESLLEKGAYVDARLASGNTPLMGLIKVKNIPEKYDLIELFIKYKSDLTLKDKDGKTAIDLVNESTDDKIKQIFYNHDIIEKPLSGPTVR